MKRLIWASVATWLAYAAVVFAQVSTEDYRGVTVQSSPNPTGPAGIRLQTNTKYLADKAYQLEAAADPDADDDAANTGGNGIAREGTRWRNTSTGVVYLSVDDSTGAAVWTPINRNDSATYLVAASDSVNPKKADYVCDGTADQVQIQAALDALPASGGVVRLLEGTYNIAAVITPTGEGWTLAGTSAGTVTVAAADAQGSVTSNTSKGTILKLAAAADCAILDVNDSIRGWTLRDLTFDGNAANQGDTQPLLDLAGGSVTHTHAIIDHCFIQNGAGVGIYSNGVRRCRIINSWILANASHGIQMAGTGEHIELINVASRYNGGAGLQAASMQDNYISHCAFGQNGGVGISLLNKTTVVSSIIFGNGSYGIDTMTDSCLTGCLFENNTTYNISSATDCKISTCRLKGLRLNSLVRCQVTGCDIEGNDTQLLTTVTDSVLSGCDIHNSSNHLVEGPVTGSTFQGCHFYDCGSGLGAFRNCLRINQRNRVIGCHFGGGTADHHLYAIQFKTVDVDAPEDNLIVGNTFENHATGVFEDDPGAGTGNDFFANTGLTTSRVEETFTASAFVGNLTGNADTATTATTAGTVTTAAQPAITSVGTLTTLSIDNLTLNGNALTTTSGALEISPTGNNGIALGGSAVIDDYPMMDIVRTLTATDNPGHGYTDSTTVNTGRSYAGFNCEPTIADGLDYTADHLAMFQANATYADAGDILNVYSYTTTFTNNGGNVGTWYGSRVVNPGGSGTYTNKYGNYVDVITGGSGNNYQYFAAGTTGQSYFGGYVGVNATSASGIAEFVVDSLGYGNAAMVVRNAVDQNIFAMFDDADGDGILYLYDKAGNGNTILRPNGVSQLDGGVDVDNLKLDTNTLSSTNTNGDITLSPNGTGSVAVPAPLVVSDGTASYLTLGNTTDASTGCTFTMYGKTSVPTSLEATWELGADGYLDLSTQGTNDVMTVGITTGYVGINKTAPTTYQFEVGGTFGVTGAGDIGATISSSDGNEPELRFDKATDNDVKFQYDDTYDWLRVLSTTDNGSTWAAAPSVHIGDESYISHLRAGLAVNRNCTEGQTYYGFAACDQWNHTTAAKAYCSYDAIPFALGVRNVDHVMSFQARPQIDITGTVDNVYALGSMLEIGANATATLIRHIYIQDPYGGGSVTTQHGIFMTTLDEATTNYGITIGNTDVDHNLLHVGVTGDPLISWDESDNTFDCNMGWHITSGQIGIGTTPAAPIDIEANTVLLAMFQGTSQTYNRVCIDVANTADSQLSFMEAASTKWSIGNNADDDAFHIRSGTGAFGTNTMLTLDTSGNATATGTVQAAGYKSSDGTAGQTATTGGLTFKNGLCTAGTLAGMTPITLRPADMNIAASNPAIPDVGTTVHMVLFDDSTDETGSWTNLAVVNYQGGTLYADIYYTMASATSGKVDFEVDVWAISDGDAADVDTESYDTANTITAPTVPGTAGYLDMVTCTLTNADSVADGDVLAIRVRRDADDATNDTATGDAEVRYIVIREG